MDEFSEFSGRDFKSVDIATPEVLIGGLIGSMIIFLFTGLAISAVGRTAHEVRYHAVATVLLKDGLDNVRSTLLSCVHNFGYCAGCFGGQKTVRGVTRHHDIQRKT